MKSTFQTGIKSVALLAVMASLLTGVSGCSLLKPVKSSERHFVLTPVSPIGSATVTPGSIAVGLGKVKIPAYLFNSSLAVRKGTNEIEYLPSTFWAERLDSGFQRVLAANLAILLPTDRIPLSAWQRDEVVAEVYVTLEEFDVDASGRGVLLARWRILSPGGDQVLKASSSRLSRQGPPPDCGVSGSICTLSALVADFAVQLAPVSNIFLRLIKSIIAPLLFGTLVYGIAGSGNMKAMGRIGLKAIVYFEIVTTVALFLGLAAVNLTKPGVGMTLEKSAVETAIASKPLTGGEFLEHVFPSSIIDSMARGEVLQIVVFAFLFGAACTAAGPKAKPVVAFAESLAEVMFKYTGYVMWLAPAGVCAAIAVTVGGKGFGVLVGLGKLVLTMYAAQAIFVAVVLGAVMAIARVPVRRFYRAVREPFLIAFSTSSSEAALPRALENMERFGVPKHIVAFVIPTGYSFNLDGSMLYLSLASVFVAQAAGIHLTLGQQVLMMFTLMLSSKGVAGVPRASLVILAGTIAAFQLPIEGAVVLLGIDAVMDMARTSVNVLGNCLATAVVARWEGVNLQKLEYPE